MDASSTDETQKIAYSLADKVFVRDLKRSAARNYGVAHSNGTYVLILDSDMYLTEDVIAECIMKFEESKVNDLGGLVIPEKSIGKGFWAKVKSLEREFYQGVSFMEAARFFPRKVFTELGGYDETLESGEDWEFSQRVASGYQLSRIYSLILHDEGKLSLKSIWCKKSFYGSRVSAYISRTKFKNYHHQQFGLRSRLLLFFRKPGVILRHPFHWLMIFVLKGIEYLAWMWGRLSLSSQLKVRE